MEENDNVEEKETIVEEVVSENVEEKKNKKKLIIAIASVIVVCFLVFSLVFNNKGKAKKVIKDYCNLISKGKYVKALKLVDAAGYYTFDDLDKDDYDDFWKEYKKFKKSDEWEDNEEEWEDILEDAEDLEEDFDKDDAIKIKVKKLKKFKKVSKNLYEVKVVADIVKDDDDDDETLKFYLMKDGINFKIVGGDNLSSIIWAISFKSLDFDY